MHACRIIEVLTRKALVTVGKVPPRREAGLKVYLNVLLGQNLLPLDTYNLLDILRELGNKARHADGPVSVADADQGTVLLLLGLHWYFCVFNREPRLSWLGVAGRPLDGLLTGELATLLAMLDADAVNDRGFLAALGLDRDGCQLLWSPVLPAVLAERLLNGGHAGDAQVVLSKALERFPDDTRLRQLQGLLWSRAGRFDKAFALLGEIDRAGSSADEETRGILGGAYKRQAAAEPERRAEWLRASYASYERGWRASRETNTYLGINAAAVALRLDPPAPSAPTAAKIRDLLERRRRDLEASGGQLGFWEQLTLAEAYLLRREWDAAARCYREADERFPEEAGAREVACGQAKEDLIALRRPDLIPVVCPG